MKLDPNDLYYQMAAAYSKAIKQGKRLIICNEGGSRAGKTFDTFDLITTICDHNRNKGLDTYILRDTLVNCRDYTLKDWKKLQTINGIPITGRESPKPEYNLFGNNIYFRGLDDEKNIEGYPSDILFVNEVLETEKSKIEGLLMRCRKLVIFDWNPKLTKHWIFDYEGRPDVLFTRTTYKNNKHLEQTVIDEIESYNPDIPENIKNKTANPFRWKVYGLGLRADQEGNVFNDSELNKFKIEDIDLDAMPKLMFVDVADQGIDYLSAPMGAIDGIKTYVFDTIFSNKTSNYTIPLLIDKIIKYDIDKVIFESNNQGLQYLKNVLNTIKIMDLENGTDYYKTFKSRFVAIPSTTNKHSRIILQAENNIIPNFYFLEHRSGQYSEYYDYLTSYKYDKSFKYDDAPDATAGLSILSQKYK